MTRQAGGEILRLRYASERSLDEAKRNPGRSAGRGTGIPDSTPFHPGYSVFMRKGASQMHGHSRESGNPDFLYMPLPPALGFLLQPPTADVQFDRFERLGAHDFRVTMRADNHPPLSL